jgi:hypothetical protein
MSVDGAAITTPEGFERFANATAGTPVRLLVRKAGQEREVSVTPIENPSSASAVTIQDFYTQKLRQAQRNGIQALRNAFRSPLGWLGMGLECEQCSVNNFGRRQSSWTFRSPPAVLTVDVDGPAHRAGLRRGDTLTTIDGVDLTTPAGGRAFAEVEPGQRVTLGVRRGGTERRVILVAVARPDATPEEVANFEEYKRTRDSSEASYREQVTASVARVQAETREVERVLREMSTGRNAADSSRRHMASLDSAIRALRNLERQRTENGFNINFNWPSPPMQPMQPMPAMAPMPSAYPMAMAAARASEAMAARVEVAPLRYSNRLGQVNVEARGYGPINTQEVGDSLIVVNTGSAEIKIYIRPAAPPR